MSFYGHQSVQNNTFQELLIFRSRYDANTTVADVDSELTGGKMFWVKTIKDYPYVEISHGKPKLEANEVLIAPTVNQPNYQSKISKTAATTSDLQFGETIKVPNLKIADTGHIIGAEVQNLTLPYIQTIMPITITGTYTHVPTISHATIRQSGAPTYNLVTTPTLQPALNAKISFNLPTFDKWGHYYDNQSQSIQMPNISVASPLSATTDGRTTTITHKTVTSVVPTFATTTVSCPYIAQLGQQTNLKVAQTDESGHAIGAVDLPFQINHPTDYIATKIFDYLTPITDISNSTKGVQTRAPLELRLAYREGQSYMTVVPGTTTPIDLMLFNHSYNAATETAHLKFKFTIEEAKEARMANGSSWTFEESTAAASYDSDSQSGQLIAIPSIGEKIKIGTFKITVSDQFEKAILLISGQPKLNTTELTIISAGTSYTNPNSGIEIWDANKVLCLPKLYINEEGHVDVKGNTYIALGDIGNSSNSEGSNNGDDSGDNGNSNDTANKLSTRLTLQVEPKFPALVRVTDTSNISAQGFRFNVYQPPFDDTVSSSFNRPFIFIIGEGNATDQFVLGRDITTIKYELIESPELYEVAYRDTSTNTNYYWDVTSLLNKVIEINDLDANAVNTRTITIPLTTQQPSSADSQLNLIKIQFQFKFNGNSTSSLIPRIYFELASGNNILTLRDVTGRPLNNENVLYLRTVTPQNNVYTMICTIDANELQAYRGINYRYQLILRPRLNNTGEQIQVIQSSCTFNPSEITKSIEKVNGDWPLEINDFPIIIGQIINGTTAQNKTTTDTKNSTTNIDTTQVENRLSTLEQSMLQLTNISDLKSVNNMESRLKLLEGQLAPVDYDTETEQMAAKNRLEEIETKVEETKAATEYNNKDSQVITIEESYRQLLLCYTGLVRTIADYIYKGDSHENERQTFIDTFSVDRYKGPTNPTFLPDGNIPEIDFPE